MGQKKTRMLTRLRSCKLSAPCPARKCNRYHCNGSRLSKLPSTPKLIVNACPYLYVVSNHYLTLPKLLTTQKGGIISRLVCVAVAVLLRLAQYRIVSYERSAASQAAFMPDNNFVASTILNMINRHPFSSLPDLHWPWPIYLFYHANSVSLSTACSNSSLVDQVRPLDER